MMSVLAGLWVVSVVYAYMVGRFHGEIKGPDWFRVAAKKKDAENG